MGRRKRQIGYVGNYGLYVILFQKSNLCLNDPAGVEMEQFEFRKRLFEIETNAVILKESHVEAKTSENVFSAIEILIHERLGDIRDDNRPDIGTQRDETAQDLA